MALSRRQDAPHDSLTVDLSTPSPARIYDYYLGGKDHFPVDREVAEQALAVVPEGRELARANRYFLTRAVTYLASQGINQFIDIGTGIPTSPNVHGVARLVNRYASVAYVDNDRQVVVHNRALLADSKGIAAISGDVRYPSGIANDPELLAVIDFHVRSACSAWPCSTSSPTERTPGPASRTSAISWRRAVT